MEFFATCAGGLERLLADELRRLRCRRVRPLKGQVAFEGELEDAYRACLWSRIASRVVVVTARVDASDSDALYGSLRAVDWASELRPGATLSVDAHGTNAELRNTRFVALRAKDAIVDALFAARGSRPVVDVRQADLTVVVRIARERATVGIDLAGEPLFRRGYGGTGGQQGRLGSLRADYAAALVAAAGCAAGDAPEALALINPGSGSLLVEAAAAALDRAPGLLHERWGMGGWAAHDEAAWKALMDEARERAEQGAQRELSLLAFDARPGAEMACAHLLRSAGIAAEPTFARTAEAWDEVLGGGVEHAAADLSWAAPLDVVERSRALSQLAGACGPLSRGTLAVLAEGSMVDRALGAEPREAHPVLMGRDEQSIRIFDCTEGVAPPVRVSVGKGCSVPVLVPASEQFAARLAKVYRQRLKWAQRNDVSCYRVYDADLPDYALTIDLFEGLPRRDAPPGRWLSLYEYAPPKGIDPELAQARLIDALAIAPQVLGVRPQDVFVRTRQRAKGGSQYADERRDVGKGQRPGIQGRPRAGSAHPALPHGAHLVDEGGLSFEVNFSLRLDCGLFLDHRDTRAMLREMAKRMAGNGRFLNLFAYTGTATCYAADGGARATTTVDLSRPSLDWARRNMERNGFGGKEHEYVQADVVRWVREQRQGHKRWDLVFCDVPTFSNSHRMGRASFDVQRDHAELLIAVSRLLTRADAARGWEGGTCVFSCNLRSFKPDVQALARAGVALEDITERTIPEDFARNKRIHHCYLVRRA